MVRISQRDLLEFQFRENCLARISNIIIFLSCMHPFSPMMTLSSHSISGRSNGCNILCFILVFHRLWFDHKLSIADRKYIHNNPIKNLSKYNYLPILMLALLQLPSNSRLAPYLIPPPYQVGCSQQFKIYT